MKAPSLAASYAALYPGLCEIARKHGYALAIHGSMARDLDLIAVPWTDEAEPAEVVAAALKEHAGACTYREINAFHGTPADRLDWIEGLAGKDPTSKPHGRLAWSLHLDHGAYIDLSVLPRASSPTPK